MTGLTHCFSRLALGFALLGAAAVSTGAQARSAHSAEELYQQALTRERAAGDMQGAIQLYRQVAASSDRVLAAKALVRLGETYERLGAKEAQGAYERVLREFSDQPEPVSVARGRLQVLRAGTAVARSGIPPALTMVFADLPGLRLRDGAQFDFSPAGDEIVFRRNAGSADPLRGSVLEIANSGGTVVRTLVPAQKEMGRASPRWSPDGRHIAFMQRAYIGADSAFAALMIVPAAGGSPRVLASNIELPNVSRGGLFWTPDGRALTVWGRSEVITMDLDGQIVRKVPLPVRHLAQMTGYSPDGRWLVFHRMADGSEQQDEMDVWILPAQGGAPVQLTGSPGFDGWPTWSADGRSVYFVSTRSGSSNVWKLDLDPRSGQPRGDPLQVTSYTDASILHPRVLNGGTRLAFALVREMSTIHVAATATPSVLRDVARGTHPEVSPDGRTIYYEGQGADRAGIFAVSAAGNAPKRLTTTKPGGSFFSPFSMSRDGASIAYFSGIGSQNVLFTVPTRGGTPREVTRFDSREHLLPAWSPDGTRLAYAHGDGLYMIGASGGTPTKIATLRGWDGWTLRWSPDGAHVAALAWPSQGRTDENHVYIVPALGGEPRRLTPPDESGYKEGLEWRPDGSSLTYMYYGRDWRSDETRMAYVDGRPTTLVLNQPYPLWDYVGRWHPAGREYYFIASIDGTWSVYAHDTGNGTQRRVWVSENASPGAGVPSFSGDGTVMALPVTRTSRQLWTVAIGR